MKINIRGFNGLGFLVTTFLAAAPIVLAAQREGSDPLPAAPSAYVRSAQNAGDVESETIYGKDDRIDLYQAAGANGAKLKRLAASTIALFEAGNVKMNPGTRNFHLTLQDYGKSRNLCKDEPFYDQKEGAFCSGSLVGPNMIMTAGHCVTSDDQCKTTKFIFGFDVRKKGVIHEDVPASEVYGCDKLIGREQIGDGADWALVKLDRRVNNHLPLKIRREGEINNGDPLFVIGHPVGLPTKIAGGAKVRSALPQGFFIANLDTFGGNSGSPVFNAKSGLIEGILVRGEQDFEDRGQCTASKHCPDNGCRGEDVTKISVIADRIPRNHRELEVASAAPKPSITLENLKKNISWQ